jgi:hypothetical protein
MAPKEEPTERGTYKFEVLDDGTLVNNAANVDRLRKLWLDRRLIKGDDIGPGDPGDFDHGAWHVACHVVGACGVRQRADGGLAWLQISHDRGDRYFASVTVLEGGQARTVPIDSAEGRVLLRESRLLGFVEGTSKGRISARHVNDPPGLFNLWRRQDFDQPIGSAEDGGRVWEHWCTERDIRPTHAIGTSVLTAFVSLVAAVGDLLIPTVARGRKEYGHPVQLRAMIRAGLVDRKSALWDGTPVAISSETEAILEEADPATSLKAASSFDWSNPPRYHMFARKIAGWNTVADVKKILPPA